MSVEIKNRWSGEVICAGETIREAAIENCVNLIRGANFSGANLSGADLRGVKFRYIAPVIVDIHQTIYAAASQPGAINMERWHSCETTHCRAGWVVFKAGEAGRVLESCIGTNAAAALIYMASDPTPERIPNFYASNEQALEDMKVMAEREAAKTTAESPAVPA